MLSYRAEVHLAMDIFLLCKITFNMLIEKTIIMKNNIYFVSYFCYRV